MRRGKFESVDNQRKVDAEDQKPVSDQKKETVPFAQSVLLYLHDLSYLLAIVIIVLLLCLRVVVVSGSSMKNTLVDGDYIILLSNTFYRTPKQGDIIVASKDSFENGEPIIKRVIAVEGQEVFIDYLEGVVYVDGVALEEDYISSPTTRDEGLPMPLVVDEGCVFVLGDNRIRSQDSRSPEIGLIDTREILGKALFLFIPGTDGGECKRDLSRIGGFS